MFNKKALIGILSEYVKKFPEDIKNILDLNIQEDRVFISINGDLRMLRSLNVIVNVLFKHLHLNDSDKFFVFDLCLSIEEAVMNIFLHSYENRKGKIEVHITLDDSNIYTEIIDFGEKGKSLDIKKILNHKPVEKFASSGRGFMLIKKAVDNVEYESANGINKLILIKNYTKILTEEIQ